MTDVQFLHFRPSDGITKYRFDYVVPDATIGVKGGVLLKNVTDTNGLDFDVLGTIKATGFTFPTGAAANRVLTTADANGGMFWSGLGTLMQSLTGYSSVVGTNQVLKNVDGAISWGAGGTAEEDPTVETFAKTALPACGAGQVLYASGGALSCVTDSTLSITEGTGISITGSGASRTIAISPEFLGSVRYQGTWDASSNAPSLSSPPAASTKGYYYVVSAIGAQFGVSWGIGDYIISNGAAWQKIDNTDVQAAISAASINALSDVEISSPQANQVLQYVSGVWKNQTANFSPWTTVSGVGIKYTGGKVGIGATIADADIISPLTVQGEVAAGSFTTAGAVSAGGGARFPRQAGTNVTPGRGPSISLESPSNNVTTSKGTPDFCDEIGECSTDNTPSADVAAEYVCPVGSGGLSYSRDVFRDASNNNWHQTITCVAGTDSYSLSTNAGTLEFANTSGAVKLNLNQNGDVSFFGSLIIPGGLSGNVLTKNADGTASWQPSASGADNWGTQVVQRDASLKGNGTTGEPLGIMACSSNGQVLKFTNDLNGDGTTGDAGWKCDTDNAGTGGDNLGNHTATQNIKLNNFWLSNDGDGEGIRVDNSGKVGIGTAAPANNFQVTNNVYPGTVATVNVPGTGIIRVEGAGGTTFSKTFKEGDTINISSAGGGRVIDTITNNALLFVKTDFNSTVSGATYSGTPSPNVPAFSVNGSGNTNIGGGLFTEKGGYFGGTVNANLLQVRGGSPAAGKFLKSTDTSGNAVWDTVPPAYTDANTQSWVEGNLLTGALSNAATKLNSTLLPALAITDVYTVSALSAVDTAAERTALGIEKGDVVVLTGGENKTYIWDGSMWQEIKAPNQVTSVSVNGGAAQTGLVTVNETDPNVSAWAKAATKPTYGFSEITGSVTDEQVPDSITISGLQAFAKTALPACGDGKVLKADGASFSCVDDLQGIPKYEQSIADFGAPLLSGFYQAADDSSTPVEEPVGDVPDTSHLWSHLITSRHSNPTNNHQLQIAGSYLVNDRLFFRKIAAGNESSNPSWNEVATRGANTFTGQQTIQNSLQSTSNPDAGVILSLRNNTLPLENGDTRFIDFGSLDGSTAFIRSVGRNLSIISGNVGIGAADPGAYKLNVAGDMRANNVTAGNVYGSNGQQIHMPGGGGDPNNNTYLNWHSGGGVYFGGGDGSEDFHVDTSGNGYFRGNVGIGTAAIPAARLSEFIGNDKLSVVGGATIGGNLQIADVGAALSGLRVTGTGDSYFMGNVGIGTSNLSFTGVQKLNVQGGIRIVDGGITVTNTMLPPGVSGNFYALKTEGASGSGAARCDGSNIGIPNDTSETTIDIQVRDGTILKAYPTSNAIGVICYDNYQTIINSISYPKYNAWIVYSTDTQNSNPLGALRFDDIAAPDKFFDVRNNNGSLQFGSAAVPTAFSLTQGGDLNIIRDISIGGSIRAVTGDLNVRNITATGGANITGKIKTTSTLNLSGGTIVNSADADDLHNVIEFTVNGSFTVPQNIKSIRVLLVGGGGGGGNGDDGSHYGGGGGGGGQVIQWDIPVVAGQVVSVIIGTKGNGGAGPIQNDSHTGMAGNETFIEVGGKKIVTAPGGPGGGNPGGGGNGGGGGYTYNCDDGAGGVAVCTKGSGDKGGDNTTLSFSGGDGGGTYRVLLGGGGGGASYGPGGNGGGGGGDGSTPSSGYGGGGGGGGGSYVGEGDRTGGNGRNGYARIIY
ncbi:MAG: hypothetical protein HYY10_03280 [Candidatus Liptonbacteria bacterium]|nr:hypothetical protein [Candidatus Liptonbacteria bacterium]